MTGAGVPVQVPGSAVSIWPATAEPLTDAATVVAGAAGAASTTAVTADVDVSLPESLVAVTTTRIESPTSSSTRTYALSVAPSMSEHVPGSPPSLHRCHWYVMPGVGVPVQVPGSAVSIWPATAEPLTDAATVVAGAAGAASTTAVTADVDVSLPESLVAVTTTRIESPTSSSPRTYV